MHRRVGRGRRRLRAPAPVPRGRAVRPHHRVLLVHLRHRRASSAPTTTPSPAATAKVTLDRLGDILLEKDKTANVTLTVSKTLQQVATDGLAGRKGAVVAIDPRDGAILAMADFPSYDPNAAGQPQPGRGAQGVGRPQRRRRASPCCPAPTGSATSRARASRWSPPPPPWPRAWPRLTQPVYPTLTELPLPQSRRAAAQLRRLGRAAGRCPRSCGCRATPPSPSWASTSAAQALAAGRRRASGSTRRPPIDLPVRGRSRCSPTPSAFARDKPALAKSAIGQQDVAATPLQMALVAAGIANNGVIMTPHVMAEVRDSEAEVARAATSPSRGCRRCRPRWPTPSGT